MSDTKAPVHVLVGYANPFLFCDTCRKRVPYWHNPDRCTCDESYYFNAPCGHRSDVTSKCPTWTTVFGCECVDKENHTSE